MKMTVEEAIKIVEDYRGIDLDMVDKVLPGFGAESKKIDEALSVLIEAAKNERDFNDPGWFEFITNSAEIGGQAWIVSKLDTWDIGEAFKDAVSEREKAASEATGAYKAAYTFFEQWLYYGFNTDKNGNRTLVEEEK